jgi:hypothetical protein
MMPVLAADKGPHLVGVPTLLGAPIGDIEDVRPGDICLAGLFYDHSATASFGARFAARQLRYASPRPSLPPKAGIRDLGDLNVFPLEPARQADVLTKQIEALVNAGGVPILVGGAIGIADILSGVLKVASKDFDIGQLTLPNSCTPSEERSLVLTIDLQRLSFARSVHRRPLHELLGSIRRLNPSLLKAVHLAGMCPDLDVTGRIDAHVSLIVLEALVEHLQSGRVLCR